MSTIIKIQEPLSTRPLEDIGLEGGAPWAPPVVDPSKPVVVEGPAGHMMKYFSPRFLGINNSAPRLLGTPEWIGSRMFVSNVFDLSHMRALTVQVKRVVTALAGSEGGAPTQIQLFIEQAFDPFAQDPERPQFPSTHESAGALRDQSLVLIDTLTFDTDPAGPYPATQVGIRGRAWDVARGAGSADGAGLFGPFGPNCRLVMFTTLLTTPTDQFWSACVLASS